MRDQNQTMEKMRLRRIFEELLDSELLQIDLQEENETSANPSRPIKRIALVARYIAP